MIEKLEETELDPAVCRARFTSFLCNSKVDDALDSRLSSPPNCFAVHVPSDSFTTNVKTAIFDNTDFRL